MTSTLTQSDKLLTRRYYGASFMAGIVRGLRQIAVDEIETAVNDLKPMATENARRIWLDRLAARFGVTRPNKASATASFFGFDGYPPATPFNQASFRPDGDETAGTIPLGDDKFQSLLKIRTGSLRSTGTQDAINEVLNQVYPGSFILDGLDMTATIFINTGATPDDMGVILTTLEQLPKPAGVGITVEEYVVFGFDGVGEIFDNAPFAIEQGD